MKTCVMAIAAEFEEPYLLEWVDWHKRLGFDDIWVVTNNWDWYVPPKGVKTYRRDGKVIQLAVYNEWMWNHRWEYDWVLVCDIDEFLYCPTDVKAWLEEADDAIQLAVPWVHFGDGSDGKTKTPPEGSVIDRFQRCEGVYNRHVKTLVHLSKLSNANNLFYVNPHFICASVNGTGIWLPWLDIFGCTGHGQYNKFEGREIDPSRPFIAHYYTKTLTEWRKRRGPEHMRADRHQYITEDWFARENHNEKECRLLHDRKNRQS